MCFWRNVKAITRLACWFIALFGLPVFSTAADAPAPPVTVMAFNTYLLPPFLKSDGHGLAADLVQYLNRRLLPDFVLVLNNVPRARLVQMHLHNVASFDGVALFLSPAFVNDEAQERFLWSPPLFNDYNVLVFNGREPPRLHGLADLVGKTFAALRDHRYAILDDMVAAGKIIKMENNTEEGNLRLLLAGRADFTQTNSMTYFALSNETGMAYQLSAVPQPDVSDFSRHILVGKAQPVLAKRINELVKIMPCDKEFRAISTRYGFGLGGCQTRPSMRK